MFTFLKLKAWTLFTLKNQIACNQNNFYKSCRTLKLPGVSRGLVVEVWTSNCTVIPSTPVWSTWIFSTKRLCHWLKKYFSWFLSAVREFWQVSKHYLHFRKLDSNFIRALPNGMLDNMGNLHTLWVYYFYFYYYFLLQDLVIKLKFWKNYLFFYFL